MASNRLGRNVVALAASAITAVYAAGYIHTQAADASLGAPAAAPSMTTAPAGGQPPQVTTTNPLPQATARPAAATAPSGQPAASSAARQSGPSLKDGIYTGLGTSRRGDVQVSLTVQAGRVASVNITGANTQYPTRFIAKLPGEVVSRQSAQIDIVGGATYSSLAFRGAVQQALQRAQG
jgi:uncharacterized protein with FMN-binding domain